MATRSQGPARGSQPIRIGILTSGGDAQGMNASVRAVVRTAIAAGAEPYAILEGWRGAVDGGDSIKKLGWIDVSSIIDQGGTMIGTARCPEFRTWEGMHAAARNLLARGIDRLVVIGGDGSLSGADEFRTGWPKHVRQLVAEGVLTEEEARAHGHLMIVGLVGSIDNDLVGTDMTIGADTALDRIVTAMDEITSTAASHQRTFVVEVMGRRCGYLALMSAVAGGADYVLTPEKPVGPGWEDDMCEKLRLGREAGRRESMVIVAEGAADQKGQRITSQQVVGALTQRLGVDARVTILGHVQRGGSPSAYDRWMSTLLGYAAVEEILQAKPEGEAYILGVQHNWVTRLPLVQTVQKTHQVAKLIEAGQYEDAQHARGETFWEMQGIDDLLSAPPQASAQAPAQPTRIAVMHGGGLAPGMNTAVRAAVRLGLQRGWTMLGVEGSWGGLMDNRIRELTWSDVEGWAFHGGAELGARRAIPDVDQFYAISRAIDSNHIDGLVVIGGLNAYVAVYRMHQERDRYPAFNIPMVLVPASIDNNLPGSELAIGADTALNNAIWALDRIKQSAAASKRCYVAEVMGRHCGYLAMMSAIASGAETAYLPEQSMSLAQINEEAQSMRASFEQGRRLYMVVVNEEASRLYDRDFLARVFEAESHGVYDVRSTSLGHIQQGGAPSPFDRLLAARLALAGLGHLGDMLNRPHNRAVYVGLVGGRIVARPVAHMADDLDFDNRRPWNEWWLSLLPVLGTVSQQKPAGPLPRIPVATAEA